MTASSDLPAGDAGRISIDDIRHRAESVKDLAVTDAKAAVDTVVHADPTKKALVAIGVLVVVASVAYFLGTRAARCDLDDLV